MTDLELANLIDHVRSEERARVEAERQLDRAYLDSKLLLIQDLQDLVLRRKRTLD